MIFQSAPPDTTVFMVLGYAIILLVIGGYLASLVIRHRNLQKDLEVLQEIQESE